MTDTEKLDLLLEKTTSIEREVKKIKIQVTELKAMDEMILDEVERVHGILNQHILDKTVHMA